MEGLSKFITILPGGGSCQFITILQWGGGSLGTPNLYYLIYGRPLTKNKLNALDPDSKGATSDWKLKVISSLRFDYLDCK